MQPTIIHVNSKDRVNTDMNRLSPQRLSCDRLIFTKGSTEIAAHVRVQPIGGVDGFEPDDIFILENASLGSLYAGSVSLTLGRPFILIDVSEHIDTFIGAFECTMTVRSSGYLVFDSIDPLTLVSVPVDTSNTLNGRYLMIPVNSIPILYTGHQDLKIDFQINSTTTTTSLSGVFRCMLRACHIEIPVQEGTGTACDGVTKYNLVLESNEDLILGAVKRDVFDNKEYMLNLTSNNRLLVPTNILDPTSIEWAPSNVIVTLIFTERYDVRVADLNANLPTGSTQARGQHEVSGVSGATVFFNADHAPSESWEIDTSSNSTFIQKIVSQELSMALNSYSINAYRTLHSVSQVRVTSSVFPRAIKTVCSEHGTDEIYFRDEWGERYTVRLPEYVYDVPLLLSELKKGVDATPISNSYGSYFFMTYRIIDKFFFELNFFAKKVLSRPMSIASSYAQTDTVPRRVRIRFDGHGIYSSGTNVLIENCVSFMGIPESAINKMHKVYVIDRDTLEILIPTTTNFETSNENTGGGQAVTVMIEKRVLFDENSGLRKLLQLPAEPVIAQNSFQNTAAVKLYPDFFFLIASFDNGRSVAGNHFTPFGPVSVLTKIPIHTDPYEDRIVDKHSREGLVFETPVATVNSIHFRFIDPLGQNVYFFDVDHSFTIAIDTLYSTEM